MELVHLLVTADKSAWSDAEGRILGGAPDPVMRRVVDKVWDAAGVGAGPVAERATVEIERQAGRVLAAWLRALYGSHVSAVGRRAAAREAPVVLWVEDETEWPWELLTVDPAFSSWHVVRRAEGVRAGGSSAGAVWSPSPQEPRVSRVMEAIGDAAPGLVHLVVDAADAALGVEGEIEPGPSLTAELRRCRFVVVNVCGGPPEPLSVDLRTPLLSAGAPACLVPRVPLAIEATIAVAGALDAAMRAGATVFEAVASARNAVRALGIPHPSARPSALRVYVASPSAGMSRPGLRPAWPPGSAEGEQVLSAALQAAQVLGWLGIEVLAGALALWPAMSAHYEGLRRIARMAPPIQGGGVTDRVMSLPLVPGWDPPALFDALCTVGWFDEIFRPPAPFAGERWCLEVAGGPQDGRWLTPEVGEIVGREDIRPDIRPETRVSWGAPVDATVSRRHLRVVSATEIEVLAPTWDDALRPCTGVITWPVGSRLRLGGTWLVRR